MVNFKPQQKHKSIKPAWLRRRLPTGPDYEKVRALLKKANLHTVCQEAKCPNLWECFSRDTATFLILGDRCTRNCRFCAVAQGPIHPPDPEEPRHVAEAVKQLNLDYVVVTSVTRDDLLDGGARHYAEAIDNIRKTNSDVRIEVLIPDFNGNRAALKTVLEAQPNVLNHNLETVQRLYPIVRPQAGYDRSLDLIRYTTQNYPGIPAKSGLMLGLGETRAELMQALADLLQAGCRILTLGQYLQPTKAHLEVVRYLTPDEFEEWKDIALEMGFGEVASGPFVRSSYHAKELFHTLES